MYFTPALFSIALFTSAFLSFSVQPILGKMLLPMVGGAPAGWIVAMAFFQIALLGGYGISYYLSRFSPWKHAVGLLLLYIAGFSFLPPVLPEVSGHVEGAALSLAVIKALAQTILIPFLALTATTAALQRVFAATTQKTAKDPYYLFIASNAGSFVGLFMYPFLLEPFSGLGFQTYLWKTVYYIAVALIASACIVAWRQRAPQAKKAAKSKKIAQPVDYRQIGKWLVLAFVPCSLSMGVTTLITTDIGGLPLFWVIPLGLYLLTFILAFSTKPLVAKKNIDFYHVLAATFMILFLGLEIGYQPGGAFILFAFVAAIVLTLFFIIAWMCHQRLADSRPDTQHLALFYFILALGGGLAGMLHAFVLPFVLPDIIEFPVVVIVSLLLIAPDHLKITDWSDEKTIRVVRGIFAFTIAGALIGFYLKTIEMPRGVYSIFYFVALFGTLLLSVKPRYLMLVGLMMLALNVSDRYKGDMVERGRNFFGARSIYDRTENGKETRYFSHGTTLHGLEPLGESGYGMNYGYYIQNSAIRHALQASQAKTAAIVGLGAGQMACYDKDLEIDFYEIDSDVVRIAKEHFSYLEKCPVRDVIVGDGRLMLQQSDEKYDALIIDAFSSDGIPMHLLTVEALEVYLDKANPNGVLLFHISNRYLNIAPAIAAIAQAKNLHAYHIHSEANKKDAYQLDSYWAAIPLGENAKKHLVAKGWKQAEPMYYPWTDDRSSLYDVLALDGVMSE